MHPSRFTPFFHPSDRRLQDVDAIARELRASSAFVRLCLVNGCPMDGDLLSAAGLLEWLFDNYDRVREAAGFKPFPPIDGVSSLAFQRLRMANALFTLFEFSESRAVCVNEKRVLREVQRKLEWALERC